MRRQVIHRCPVVLQLRRIRCEDLLDPIIRVTITRQMTLDRTAHFLPNKRRTLLRQRWSIHRIILPLFLFMSGGKFLVICGKIHLERDSGAFLAGPFGFRARARLRLGLRLRRRGIGRKMHINHLPLLADGGGGRFEDRFRRLLEHGGRREDGLRHCYGLCWRRGGSSGESG